MEPGREIAGGSLKANVEDISVGGYGWETKY